jgi:DnaJ-class molecular chaperone
MSINGNTRILISTTCNSCKGKGEETISVDTKSTHITCRMCEGTGRQHISADELYRYIKQELAKSR